MNEKINIYLNFYKERLSPYSRSEYLKPFNHVVIFCREGNLKKDNKIFLDEGKAAYIHTSLDLNAGNNGAVLWCWELVDLENNGIRLSENDAKQYKEISELISIPKRQRDALIRCDTVSFPPSGCAFTHTHAGPGIRVLLEGEIRIDGDQSSNLYKAGDAWFENGIEPVFAQATKETSSSFIRVIILPGEFIGKTSITYVNEEDLGKPKTQIYKGYIDEPLK
jgi:quercetin dioxygenase-like cupin family protein